MRVLEYKMRVAFILVLDKLSTVSFDTHATLASQLSWNLGSSVFWNPQDLSRPVQGLLCSICTFVHWLICNVIHFIAFFFVHRLLCVFKSF
jgi:hypothetical protein